MGLDTKMRNHLIVIICSLIFLFPMISLAMVAIGIINIDICIGIIAGVLTMGFLMTLVIAAMVNDNG